jgi:hypothetical protein
MTGASVAPAVLTGTSGTLLSDIAPAGVAGRAMSGTVGLGRRERLEAVIPQRVGPPQRALRSPITVIVAELPKLAELRNSEVLTDEEFTELKGRLIGRRT